MKLILLSVLLLLIVLVLAEIPPSAPAWLNDPKLQDSKVLWKEYKKSFKKPLKSKLDDDKDFENFLKHKKHVEDHQELVKKGIATFQIDLNKFADIGAEKFKKTRCGTSPTFAPIDENVEVYEVPLSRQLALTTWDIRVNGPGLLTTVKDQQACGDCWAFSVSSVLENAYSRLNSSSIDLSEQQQLDCNAYTSGCDGGWFTTAFKYIIEKGLTTDGRYPYVGVQNACNDVNAYRPYTQKGFVKLANDPAQIQAYLRTNGSCATCVDADQWQLYVSGIFNLAGDAPQCNHAVAIVGYGPGYWLIKNSWGSDWGEAGYIRVSSLTGGGIFTQYVYAPKI